MKTINRAKIKGNPLDEDCKTAKVCTEFSNGIKYCFCYGIVDLYYDEYLDKCKNCKACVSNMPDNQEEFELLNHYFGKNIQKQ